jgi:hypothetical protein
LENWSCFPYFHVHHLLFSRSLPFSQFLISLFVFSLLPYLWKKSHHKHGAQKTIKCQISFVLADLIGGVIAAQKTASQGWSAPTGGGAHRGGKAPRT